MSNSLRFRLLEGMIVGRQGSSLWNRNVTSQRYVDSINSPDG
jgi:hypothetical protein